MTDPTPLDRYVDLVRAIGPGFHPDTRGDDYTSLPEDYDAAAVDATIADAAARFDVYAVAIAVVADSITEHTLAQAIDAASCPVHDRGQWEALCRCADLVGH